MAVGSNLGGGAGGAKNPPFFSQSGGGPGAGGRGGTNQNFKEGVKTHTPTHTPPPCAHVCRSTIIAMCLHVDEDRDIQEDLGNPRTLLAKHENDALLKNHHFAHGNSIQVIFQHHFYPELQQLSI
jgi:hypothetical protein